MMCCSAMGAEAPSSWLAGVRALDTPWTHPSALRCGAELGGDDMLVPVAGACSHAGLLAQHASL